MSTRKPAHKPEAPKPKKKEIPIVSVPTDRDMIADEMADLFDDLFKLLTPERLLHDPKATGEGVKVCLIDSGVERAALEEKYRRLGREIKPIEGKKPQPKPE